MAEEYDRTMRVGDTEPSIDFLLRRPDINGKLQNVNVYGDAAYKVEVKASFTTTPTVTEWTRELTRLGGNNARLDFESGDLASAGVLELEITVFWTETRTETLPDLYTIEVLAQKS